MGGTQAQALAEAQRLAACLRARGVTVSIELQQGVSTSGWLDSRKIGVLAHHTVSSRAQGATPCLGLVKRGRPDVPGPLCNGYGGFDEVYRIITMGWANHAGAGGPLTLGGVTIPKDNGRPYLWGTEFEGGINDADFTPSYRLFMARSHLGVLDYLGRPIEAHGEHLTWAPGRKVDRLHYTTESGRNELRAAAAVTGGPTSTEKDDPMTLALARLDGSPDVFVGDGVLRRHVPSQNELNDLKYKMATGVFPGNPEVLVVASIDWLGRDVATLAADVDVEQLANELVGPLAAALPPHMGVVEVSDGSVERIAEGTADTLSTRLAQ